MIYIPTVKKQINSFYSNLLKKIVIRLYNFRPLELKKNNYYV